MYFAGVDCSSKSVHVVILNNEGNIIKQVAWKSSVSDMDQRLITLMRDFQYDISLQADTFFAIENPVYIQNIKATVGITQVIAGVKLVLGLFDMKFLGVDNRSWKKSVLADGNASKEKIMLFAETKWGEGVFIEQDFADAACLAFWGLQRFGKNQK